ncbi:MAG: threonylcarbamoyl-AMP synthase [Chloroflexota bacterium]|nr:MAG: threonylcarbamoyl-AMP synthase [Chloroflexota bacterium]
MKTKVISIQDAQALPQALEILKSGGLVAFPTDTVYGVGGDVFNPQAIESIYAVKERPREKALPILLGDAAHLSAVSPPPQRFVQRLMDSFWPGPLTLVLPAKSTLPPQLSPYPTVGVRVPAHEGALTLLRASGPLAATSANISGRKAPQTAQGVLEQLGGRIDLILDGGRAPGGESSTVVDCASEKLKILREGPILLEEIERIMSNE